jgi:hypothetical protein
MSSLDIRLEDKLGDLAFEGEMKNRADSLGPGEVAGRVSITSKNSEVISKDESIDRNASSYPFECAACCI